MKKEVKKDKTELNEKNSSFIPQDVNRIIKFVCYISVFFASIFAIIVFVFGIIATISVLNTSSTEIIHNNFVTTYISNISNCTFEEVEISLLTMGNRLSYALFNIVFPCLALVCGAILLIFLAHLVMQFFQGLSDEKELFNTKKLKKLENILSIFSVILFISWVVFNRPSMIFVLLFYLLFFIIYCLFKKCMEYYSSK